jgi:hypothetical protein
VKFIPSLSTSQVARTHTDIFGCFDNAGGDVGHWSGVEENGQIISVANLTDSNPNPILNSIGTLKSHRRKGAATFLLEQMHEHHSKEYGDVFVAWCNTAAFEGLLKKVGYEEIPKRGKSCDLRVRQFIRIPGAGTT